MRELVCRPCTVCVWEKDTEVSKREKECRGREGEVRTKDQKCQTLENDLQDALQEKNRLNLELLTRSWKAEQYDQVKSDYELLRQTVAAVIRERDLALQERTQLRGKLENLEQVLKHMREAAERRQQLELEHEQALAVLNAKQQEIDLLQKAQVEAKKEHEGAVLLLEAKVRELEEKCRTQSEQFNLLSKELEKFRLQSGKFDLFTSDPLTICESPGSPNKSLSQLLNGLAAPVSKGNESPTHRTLISEFIRPLQISGDKAELLSVKPTFLSRSRPSSPRQSGLTEMDSELSPTTRPKARYTGKIRLCIARYSYNPYDGPNENPEAELPLVAGKYLYVYGTMDEDGFYEGELLDGQRGLVPSNFVDFVQDEEMPPVQPGDGSKEVGYLSHGSVGLTGLGGLLQDTKLDGPGLGLGVGMSLADLPGTCSNGMGTLDVSIDEIGEDIVPYPRRITLIKQLAKSVIVAWEPPLVAPGWGNISAYNVLVDKEVRATVPFGARTKSLIEKLNLATCTYRVSVQCVTERGPSDEMRCTLLVGKDVVVAPYCLRMDNITQVSAELSWMPSNSNYSHTIFLNDAEYDVVKASNYRYQFFNLKSMMVYRVRLVAQPHQMPWQLPLEQREKKESSVEFCTQPAGPPQPPQEVQVQCAQVPGVLQVRWKPPPLTSNGTSNGASVIGYAVCTKGQKIAEVMFPNAEYVLVELNRVQCLEAREVVVRTLSTQGESQDSSAATIPHNLLVPPPPPPQHPPLQQPPVLHPPPHTPRPQVHPPPYPQTYPPSHPQPQIQSIPRPQSHTLPQPLHPPHPSPLPPLQPMPQTHPRPKPLASARESETKEPEAIGTHQGARISPSWDPACPPACPPASMPPSHGHALEPPHMQGRRSPSPQRILPQPQGAPIPNTVAKAIAREAAQRVAENNRVEKGNIFSERSGAVHPLNSDEEEDGYEVLRTRRRGASVDDFLRGSELGRQPQLYSHSEEYQTESSRGSDLSDIMEEDEEELYSEMQLEEGRRRSINSHNTLKILGNTHTASSTTDRLEHSGRRLAHSSAPLQRRSMMVPSIDGYSGRDRRSPDYYEESEPDDLSRIFVALFDYDPISMSPNPDGADEELPFKEGQIIKVYGDKDTDGFYRGEVNGRMGLIPCNMVSEIQTEDEEMMDQLVKQGFLPLNTPVEKIVNCNRFKDGRSVNRRSRKSKRERNRRSGRQQPLSTRRMVALYDYDPRESSPNVDVEAELTFCAGDIINVFGEIDEDGFYYGELNGHKGLVPSNFLEEVPDDVEVYLTDTPARYAQDAPARIKTKRVPLENTGPPRRAASPTVRQHLPGSGPSALGPGSPVRGPRDLASKKKKGLLSKGKKLLKRLGAVK
ncbi:RIMS-binding protein 2 isoform X2 [Brienomyrus brachyistius]|uniref:RIMS-binding protein 2 isoform X2 n=1 Tax=Brienomyrus brachyistius TaxID=42636 RepID=UPI0020B37DCB|nr:RIMS-binding protein 2 isoform X2 [Brienomyrus brachyistius]